LKFAVDFHDVVYSVKVDDTFSAYDFVDINVIDNQLSLSVQNLLNGAGGLTVTQSTTALTNQDVILKVDYSSNYKELRYSIDGGRSYHTYKASEGIVMKENGEIKFQMIALNGEIGEASYFVKNIDKEPPAVPSISPSTTAFTRNDVILTVSFAEDAVIKEFSRDGITWRPMLTNKLTVNENSTVLFRCFDEAGNMSMSEYTVTNIDGGGPVKPIITLSETAPTNQDVVVTAKFSGYSLSDSYSLNGTLWRPYIGPVTMSKNGVVYFRSIDEEGMVATASVNVTNIDRKAPGKPKVQTVVFNDWTTEVVVTATFAADSVRNEYSTDGVNYKLYSGPISCLSNTKLYFRCVDAAGNYSKVATKQVKRSKWVVSDEVLTVEDSFANTISAANTGDSYAFEVTAGKYTIDGEFGLNLTAKVVVRDSSGKLRLQGNIKNGVLDIDAKLLEKGKYTLTVDRTKNGYGDYTLDVKGVAYTQGNNSDDAWNSSYVQSNVRSVGVLESGKSEKLAASEWVGFGDAQDYIKLDVQYDGEYSFQVTDLSNNVKLTVYEDRDGKLKKVKSASIKKKASGSLSGVELDSDSTYYLLLEATGAKKGLNTDYELEISASYQDIVEDILYGAESFKTFDLAAGDNLTGDLLDDKNQGMLA